MAFETMPSAAVEPTRIEAVEPRARAAFVRLCIIGLLAYGSYAICRVPLLPLLARDLGATPPMVGLVVGASTLTGILLKLPAGAWSDVLGRRRLLVAGTVVFATMPFTYFFVTSLGALVAVRFVHGAATAIVGPVAAASISDVVPPARRGTWLSTYSTAQGVGQALGPVAAGYLIAAGRYDLAFLAAGLAALATPLLAATWPSTRSTAVSSRRAAHVLRGVIDVGRHPLILMTSLSQAAQFALNGTLNAFLPLFAREELGLGPAQLGWLFAMQTSTTLAARPLMGALSDRVGRRGVIVAGLSLCCAAVWQVSLAGGFVDLLAAVAVYAVGVAITTAATGAFITDLSRRSQYGAAHGVFGSIYDVGDALGPIAAGTLVAAIGYSRMFQTMALVGIVASGMFWMATRTAERGRVAGSG